ncbi:MAG: molybdopterin dinucleotide binding domain-containing protein [Myxococcota bacterium]
MPNVHYRACNLCEAMCGVKIEFEGTRVLSIRGDEADPLSRGHLCPKALALQALYEDPDRLRRPLRRTKSGWEELGWDAALDAAAQGLHDVQQRHGTSAVGLYLGNPNVHNTGSMLFTASFARALKTKHKYSATSVDQLPHMLVAYWMFGHQLLLPVPDVDRTQYLLMLGANPIASNGSLMTAPGMRRRLEELRARGGKLVVVDPRRTETAERADQHLSILPGRDAFFLLGLLRVLFDERRVKPLTAFVDGLAQLDPVLARFPLERCAAACGLDAETIRTCAREFSDASAAVCYGRIGLSTQPFGTLCAWLVNVINLVTGNFDRAGGAMLPKPAIDPRTLPKGLGTGRGSHGRWKSRVRGLPETGGELPVATLAEDILTEGEGRLRALVTVAGNPVLSTPNGRQLDRALADLEFMVAVDPYLNETTRHASLILPPPSPLERPHYDLAFHLLAVRDTTRFAPALFEAGPDARHDWQILLGLAERLEALRGGGLRSRVKWRALQALGVERMLDVALRLGPYGGLRGLTLAKVRRAEHGLDLGPLKPCLPGVLQSKGKRVTLVPEPVLADLARLEASEHSRPTGLLLINRRHLRDNNSWLHNVPKLISGAARCTVMIHPDDAATRGLAAGQRARVRSRTGELVLPVEVTDAVMKGVVSIPHGYGHGREGVRLQVAQARAGESVNDLTDELAVDALSGNAAFSGVEVEVTRAE